MDFLFQEKWALKETILNTINKIWSSESINWISGFFFKKRRSLIPEAQQQITYLTLNCISYLKAIILW